MGCETSIIRGTDQDLDMNEQQFKLTYRQFIMNSRGQVFDFYHLSTILHRSHTGVIRKVFHRTNKSQRICKIISVQNLRQLSCVQEVQVLKNLEHPNVVKIYEYFIEKHFLYMIFQLINGSSLHDGLSTQKQISLENVICIMKQLLSVVNMMHSQNIAHRNIHPGHIMLQVKDKNFIVKLIDFSSSAFSLSPKLTSPKPYRYQQAYNRKQSQTNPLKYDVYCCGLIFLTLLGGGRYLKNICGKQQQTIKQVLAKAPVVTGLESLLCSMLKANPQQRSTSIDVLNHKLFNENLNKKEDKILLRNLRQFNVRGKLKSTLWMFATIKLQTLYNRMGLMNQFYSLDKNKDGKIQFQQLSEGLMNTFAISQEQANKQTQRIFKTIDKNNNDQIDFYEFVMGAYVVGKNLSDSQLILVFNQIDANKDGVITSQQLNEAVEGIDQFDLLASNGNKLDFINFKKIMKSYIARISGR